MVAWADNSDGSDFKLTLEAVSDAVNQEATEVDGLRLLVSGFINLSGQLLVKIVDKTGVDEADTLKQLALQIADE